MGGAASAELISEGHCLTHTKSVAKGRTSLWPSKAIARKKIDLSGS